MSEQTIICPCCPNACHVDELQCGKGKQYFNNPKETSQKHHHKQFHHRIEDMDNDEILQMMLHKCGRMLSHHSGGKQSQKRILSILNKRGNMTQRELQEILEIQSGSLSEILGKIEQDNLIIRQQNQDDKRNIDLILTDEGNVIAQQNQEEKRNKTKRLFSCLEEEEKQQLIHSLHKVLHAWKQTHGDDKHHHTRHHKHHDQ